VPATFLTTTLQLQLTRPRLAEDLGFFAFTGRRCEQGHDNNTKKCLLDFLSLSSALMKKGTLPESNLIGSRDA
jgi:hypothetical protein